MKEFVAKLLASRVTEAKEVLEKRIQDLVEEKINQVKLRLAAKMYEEFDVDVSYNDVLDEASGAYNTSNVAGKNLSKRTTTRRSSVLRTGRTKIIRVRIRKGKIQRRKKFSAVKGYTIRGGKLTRMSPAERRNRKVASGRSKFKRRAKLRQSLRKRRMSIRKRRAMGI